MELKPSEHYNPYDYALHESQPEPEPVNEREPFTDAMRHGDLIAGHQRNRMLSDYPKRTRPWVRIWAIVTLTMFLGAIVIDLTRVL